MKPTYADLEKRVAELERRVKELETAPRNEFHYHYHQPTYQQPYSPTPTNPVWPRPYIGDPLPNTVQPYWIGDTFTFTCQEQNLRGNQ